jgi:hypothetical protein
METRPVTSDTSGQYPRLHVFVVFVGVLSVLLALDVVYASLLVHSYTAKQLAAHRERRALRRAIREQAKSHVQTAAARHKIPVYEPAFPAHAAPASSSQASNTRNMGQAA